ncbi:MAG: pilus assembly protein CpaF [Alphaproteobacteria bacterium RIFCSPHIGHO2_12_FULL_66_14]|nr:MAG: pilus assembly protein CpaF [Alphaproteobacteria bacterium RIFCSPHIGHO2_12_FULL_66_14]
MPAADAAASALSPPPPPPASAESVSPVALLHREILGRIEPAEAVRLSEAELRARVWQLVVEIGAERRLLLNSKEQQQVARELVDDMIGHGPLEPLLEDPTVSDILVNGWRQVYVERKGKLELTGIHFRDDLHVMHMAQRIATLVGRRIDQSSPMLDARLADGSRVNVVIPPLSLKGPAISIRKFSKSFIDFARMVSLKTASSELARALEIIARCRLNILISGGTGSGKTTLLNAMSGMIDPRERIVTIEDTAELQLQQPHVVQLESRPANVEGEGQVTQRDLVRNALRMRPDRIIVGEVRGPEAFDMMQAMNTGHNGSMSTVHANTAHDALSRLENMVLMANLNLPSRAIRNQIASALDVIVQIERMRDGTRRITEVAEVVGLEGETLVLAPLFTFKFIGEDVDGSLRGTFEASGIRPRFLNRLAYYGLEQAFLDAIAVKDPPSS